MVALQPIVFKKCITNLQVNQIDKKKDYLLYISLGTHQNMTRPIVMNSFMSRFYMIGASILKELITKS